MKITAVHRGLGLEPRELDYDMIVEATAKELREQADLDWKAKRYDASDRPKDIWQSEFAKDVAAMANSGGGLIVMGIEEERSTSAASGISPVAPLTDGDERTFRQVAYSRISPPVSGLIFRNLRGDEDRGVIALWVPPSIEMPHLISRDATSFGAPFRDGARTEWMREPRIQSAYQSRFSALADRRERRQELFREITSNSPTRTRLCFLAVAIPSTPRPVALGRLTRDSASAVLVQASTIRSGLIAPGLSPMNDNAGALENVRPGPRRMTSRYRREEPGDPRLRSAEASIHDDGTATLWWSLGGVFIRR